VTEELNPSGAFETVLAAEVDLNCRGRAMDCARVSPPVQTTEGLRH
jgi:hypothetical protein